MIYDSIYKKHSNTIIDWCPMDTKELYSENLIKNHKELKKFNWLDNQVVYKFNQHGFRCPNFDNKPSIAFLGCSYTLGIGINIEDTWSFNIAKNLNLHYVNLGQGGASNDTAFRLAYYWIPIIKPKIVFLLRPEPIRLEIISKHNGVDFLLPNSPTQYSLWYNDWMLEETNSFINLQKNTLGISEICKQNNIKFEYLDSSEFIYGPSNVDLARDLAHPGIESNKNIIPKILSLIDSTT